MMTLLFAIKDIWRPFCFQNTDTITLRQALLSICILCKSDEFKTLKILEQTLRPENFKSVVMAIVAAGYPPKSNQL